MTFDEMILEAAKSIAAATSALVKAASAAQRELVAAGKVIFFSRLFYVNVTYLLSSISWKLLIYKNFLINCH